MKAATRFFNLRQRLRSLLQQPSLLCYHSGVNRSSCKHGCAPGEIFRCEVYDRLMAYCMGAGDEYESICDDCWAIANQLETAVAAVGVEDDAE